MNFKYLASTSLAAMLLLAAEMTAAEATANANAVAGASGAAAVAASSNSNSYSPGSASQDPMRNFQLGNYSYELVRFGQYDINHDCLGHRARHAERVMANIERVCSAVADLSYPAQKPARMLLREGNYFDCGRDQLRVDVIDREDAGQQCAVQFINANGMTWVNGAQAHGISLLALLALLWSLVASGTFTLL